MSSCLKKLFLLPTLLFFIMVGIGTYYLDCFIMQHLTVQPENQFFVVDKGMAREELARRMYQKQLIKKSGLLPLYIRFHPELGHIKAGVYQLSINMTVKDFLLLLNSGKEAQLSVKFIEGTKAADWIKVLQTAPMLKREIKETDSFAEIAKKIGIKSHHIEGWFYPDTYNYVPNTTDIDLLKRAYREMHKNLQTVWQNRDDNLPYRGPYELLIMASLIEKETGIESERHLVASVFINRLNQHMKLQTDPAVIYGLGSRYRGVIRRLDLQDPNDYNTYIIKRLPPTPIAMPGYASLEAAAHPAKTNYFYFVADGRHGHRFSSDLSSHNKAVSEYLKVPGNNSKE